MTPDDPRSVHSLRYHAAYPLPYLLRQRVERHRAIRVRRWLTALCLVLVATAIYGCWPVVSP